MAVGIADLLKGKIPEGEKLEWYLDEKDILADRVEAWYPLVVAMLTDAQQAVMPARPIFRNDQNEQPLQIADLVAYCVRSEVSQIDYPLRKAFDRLVIYEGFWQTFDSAALEWFFNMNLDEPTDRSLLNPRITEAEMTLRLKRMLGRDDD